MKPEFTYAKDTAFLALSLPELDSAVYYVCHFQQGPVENALESAADFIFAPFDTSNAGTYAIRTLEKVPNFIQVEFVLPNLIQESTELSAYQVQFEKAMRLLQQGTVQKIVLSRTHVSNYTSVKPDRIFEYLINAHPSCFTYMLYVPNRMCWIGSSPEPLLVEQNNQYLTAALAGTRSLEDFNSGNPWGQKEQEEHRYIETYLQDAFKEANISFDRSERYTAKAGKMVHLRSDFKIPPECSLNDILSIIHPGPALSGYPVNEAIKQILSIESHQRQFYTGYFGFIRDKKHPCLYANLRCMQLGIQNALLYAGGGLTKDSKLQSEWEETELKLLTMLDALKAHAPKTYDYGDIR